MQDVDIVICGAGIAGASLAWRLAGHGRVLLLERESQPGYHSTGRSAAMFMESYGPPQVRALTRASRSFLTQPPPGFSDVPLLHPRGVLYVASHAQREQLEQTWRTMQEAGQRVGRIDAQQALARVPCLRPDELAGAITEDDAMDLDVHALHQGFLRGARAVGATLWCDAEVQGGTFDGLAWTLRLADGRGLRAGLVVNAAGAWADELAARCGLAPLGLQPKRRSAFTFTAPEGMDPSSWPSVIDIEEGWYFKPDAGRLLGSPANADPTHAHDVQPEELDIALGIHGIEQATTLRIRRPASTWAGLRTFAPDGEIVIGHDAAQPRLFWLAGQGGYGLQSAVGASALAAALVCGGPMPDELVQEGVSAAAASPQRLR
jgi:D-arginine dehydrogenase